MFNLSDKELDRLSREASQEFDPGDVLGPRSWERLEPQLHKELGGTSPNPFRGFRRSPFFYVPAILLVAGVFYFVKQSYRSNQTQTSGSPPTEQASTRPAATTEPISSTKNPDHSSNSTPPVTTPSVSTPSASTSTAVTTPAAPTPATTNPGSAAAATTASTTSATPGSATAGSTATNPATAGPTSVHPTTVPYPDATTRTHSNKPGRKGKNHPSAGANPNNHGTPADASTTGADHNNPGTNASTGANHSTGANAAAPHELTLSTIHTSRPARQHPTINDSALRAYTAKSATSPISPAKSKSLHINKSLQFGLSLAPDFSSVNSLAGDKPGSTIGFTLDYQFTNRWYLSTGLFLDRKNYSARAQDYHVPYDYYRANNLHNVNFVKGSFNMIEIPLNLRYDFSVTGNTLFFASAGASSYLMTNENCNYYFDSFGRENCMTFNYNNRKSFLFSSVNLSLGVETGISNNLSIVVAPYVKIPSRNIGFGQIQMNSVGINFALKFAPTISRRRK